MPFVYVGESHGFLMCDRCYIDYEEGAYRMVSHLLKMNPLALEEGGFHLFLDQEKTGRIRQREEGSWRALEEARGAVEHGIPQKTQ